MPPRDVVSISWAAIVFAACVVKAALGPSTRIVRIRVVSLAIVADGALEVVGRGWVEAHLDDGVLEQGVSSLPVPRTSGPAGSMLGACWCRS